MLSWETPIDPSPRRAERRRLRILGEGRRAPGELRTGRSRRYVGVELGSREQIADLLEIWKQRSAHRSVPRDVRSSSRTVAGTSSSANIIKPVSSSFPPHHFQDPKTDLSDLQPNRLQISRQPNHIDPQRTAQRLLVTQQQRQIVPRLRRQFLDWSNGSLPQFEEGGKGSYAERRGVKSALGRERERGNERGQLELVRENDPSGAEMLAGCPVAPRAAKYRASAGPAI